MHTNNTVGVVFARVVSFHPNHTESAKGFGFAQTQDGKDFYLPMWACRKILAGPTAPDFSFEEWGQWPRRGDEIVILPDAKPAFAGKAPRAWRWGYRRYWDLALNQIKDRPMYRVVGENRFKGQVMRNGAREQEVAVGMMEELQAKFPRGVANDPLGTEQPYRSGPCSRLNRWFVFRDAEFVPCDDPRPNPNPVALAMVNSEAPKADSSPANELERELEELAASAGGKRAGTKTRRPHAELVPA